MTAFVARRCVVAEYAAVYKRLIEGAEAEKIMGLTTTSSPSYVARQSDFLAIPGQPIAYWISERMRQCFRDGTPLGDIAEPRVGLQTGENARFLRRWHEVSHSRVGFRYLSREAARESRLKWFPYNKGGEFRRWFGNSEFLVNWENDGKEIQHFTDEAGYLRSRPQSLDWMFRPAITWSFISSSFFAVRCSDPGFLFDVAGSSAFPLDDWRDCIAGFLCSSIAFDMMKALNPTMNFQVGNVASLPVLRSQVLARKSAIDPVVCAAVQLARTDWDSFETSWDFQALPVLRDQGTDAPRSAGRTLAQSQAAADAECLDRFQRMKQLEEENNRLFIDAYGLQDELSPAVPDDQITLYRPDRAQDIQRLISYALGCLMGRYSLDQPGLIYAHSGNVDFEKMFLTTDNTEGTDKTNKKEDTKSVFSLSVSSVLSVVKSSFAPDPDGIVPLTETDWFPDDAANRFVEFLSVAWPGNLTTDITESTDKKDNQQSDSSSPVSSLSDPSLSVSSVLSVVKSSSLLEENLKFVAESLGPNNGESPRDTLRRYLATGFFKHHLQTYKRRPIYWLFSSGKQRAFQCLVYLHRYHAGTLARMRTEYVIPLQSQLAARIEHLEGDKAKATSTSHRKKLQKEQDDLKKQQAELHTFEEKLKHAADQKISLDLDDGVKVNYGKFGDLLADVKAVCGTKDED